MQRFQHFLFTSASWGVVQAQEAANGPFQEFKLLKASRFEAAEAIEKNQGTMIFSIDTPSNEI
jgi:hypothetical protein